MATGRTVSSHFLTPLDDKILQLCQQISTTLMDSIADNLLKKDFKEKFGKISFTRDAGAGRGGGKLQRDALTTRGIQGKAPFSNRNFRWHNLVAAQNPIPFAKEIERIEIEEGNTLNFIIKVNEQEVIFPSEKVHELSQRYVVLPKHWLAHLTTLRNWNDTQWTQNSCIITAYEACLWQDAVESYAVLGISVVVGFYKVDFDSIYSSIVEMLSKQSVDNTIILPSKGFPIYKEDIISCPLCKISASQSPETIFERERELRWKPNWITNKRKEGDDWSVQIMHVAPLAENEIRHKSSNVRFGHRWCNVAMTDHSVEETLNFMEFIVKAHNRI